MNVSVLGYVYESRQEHQSCVTPQNWSYRWWGATQRGLWELNVGLLQESSTLSTAEPSWLSSYFMDPFRSPENPAVDGFFSLNVVFPSCFDGGPRL